MHCVLMLIMMLIFTFGTAIAAAEQGHHLHSNEVQKSPSGSGEALSKFIQDVLAARDELDSIRDLRHGEGASMQTAPGQFYQDSDFPGAKGALPPRLHSSAVGADLKPASEAPTKDRSEFVQRHNSKRRGQSDKDGMERDADLLNYLLRFSRGGELEEGQVPDTSKLSHLLEELKTTANSGLSQQTDARKKRAVKVEEGNRDRVMNDGEFVRFKNQQHHQEKRNGRFMSNDGEFVGRQYEDKDERHLKGEVSDGGRERAEGGGLARTESLEDSASRISQKAEGTAFEDPVVVKYFRTHGRHHDRRLPQDLGNGNILFLGGGESNQDPRDNEKLAHAKMRQELEDADGLQVGMHARVGTRDNQLEREDVNQDRVTPKSDRGEDIKQKLEEKRRIFDFLGAGRQGNYPSHSTDEQNNLPNELKRRGLGVSDEFVQTLPEITSGESNYLQQKPGGRTDNLPDFNENMLMKKYGRFLRDTCLHLKNGNNNKQDIVTGGINSHRFEKSGSKDIPEGVFEESTAWTASGLPSRKEQVNVEEPLLGINMVHGNRQLLSFEEGERNRREGIDSGRRQRREVVKRPGVIFLEEEDVETAGQGQETSVGKKGSRDTGRPRAGGPVNGVGETNSPKEKRGFYGTQSDNDMVETVSEDGLKRNAVRDTGTNEVSESDSDLARFVSGGRKLIKAKRVTDPELRENMRRLKIEYGDNVAYMKGALKETGEDDDASVYRRPDYTSQAAVGSNSEDRVFDASLRPERREIHYDNDAFRDRDAYVNEPENVQGGNEHLVLEKTSSDYEVASKEQKELVKSRSSAISKSPKRFHTRNADHLKRNELDGKSSGETARIGRSTQEEEFQTEPWAATNSEFRVRNTKRSTTASTSARLESESVSGEVSGPLVRRRVNETGDPGEQPPLKLVSNREELTGHQLIRETRHNLEPFSHIGDILHKMNRRDENLQETHLPKTDLQPYKNFDERRDVNSAMHVKPKRSLDNAERNDLDEVSFSNVHSSGNIPNVLGKGRDLVKRDRLDVKRYENNKLTREHAFRTRSLKAESLKEMSLRDRDDSVGSGDNRLSRCSRHTRHSRSISQGLFNITFSPQELDQLISEGNLPVLKRVKRLADKGREGRILLEGAKRVREMKEVEDKVHPESASIVSFSVVTSATRVQTTEDQRDIKHKAEDSSPEVSSATRVQTTEDKRDIKHEAEDKDSSLGAAQQHTGLLDGGGSLINTDVKTSEDEDDRGKDESVIDAGHIRSEYTVLTTNEKGSVNSAGGNEITH